VPAMILTLIQFIMAFFAAFGFQQFIGLFQKDDDERRKLMKYTIISGGVLLAVGVVALLVSGMLKYHRPQDLQQYNAQTLEMIKGIRKEFLLADAQRLIFFALGIFAISFAFLQKWYRQTWLFAILAIGLLLFDLGQIQGRFLMEKVNGRYTHLHLPGNLEETHFKQKPADEFLLE